MTVFFLLMHLLLMFFHFNKWSNGDWLVIVYSCLQVGVGFYSLGLTIGEVALQAVLVSVKTYLKWVTFILISTATVMLVVSISIYFYDPTVKEQGVAFITNQILLNGPILLFILPFEFFLDDIDRYIEQNFPEIYIRSVTW